MTNTFWLWRLYITKYTNDIMITSTTTTEILMFMLITVILLSWMTTIWIKVQNLLYSLSRCLHFWLNEKCKENGCLKNEHAILLQVQCFHTASLFWHTHQAQWHPTHQLSAHVKFTQCADRQRSSHICCVSLPACVPQCMMCESKCVCLSECVDVGVRQHVYC